MRMRRPQQERLAVVYGDVGTGKTTILNEPKRRFGDQSYTIAVQNNPNQMNDTALLMRSTGHLANSLVSAFRYPRGTIGAL